MTESTVILGLTLALMGALGLFFFLYLKLNKNNTQLQLDNAELEAQLTQHQHQVDELNHRNNQLTQQIEQLNSALTSAESANQGNLIRLQEREQQLTDTKQQLTASLDKQQQLQQECHSSKNQLVQLQTSLDAKEQQFEQQQADIKEQKQQLKIEFSNLANEILEQKGKSFSQSNQNELQALLTPFKQQIDSFQKRVNDVHSESIKGQANLAAELKKVLDVGTQMSDEANNLATALKGEKKTAGNWGEIQLERTLQLAGLVKGDHYETQDKYLDNEGNRRLPDFVIKLPDNKHIVIDSKVSLVAYDQAVSAETDHEITAALDSHVGAVKNHIDDLHKKDYSNLVGMRSPSFVLMFMPIEPAYIEALKHKKDLFNYGYEKNVILVSHTTLMPILKTVANLWRIEQGNAQAAEISEKAGEIYNQVCVVAERLQKLGKTLNTVSNQYNDTVKGLAGKQGLAGKVDRFATLSAKVSKTMPALEPNHTDIEHERLELIAEAVEAPETTE